MEAEASSGRGLDGLYLSTSMCVLNSCVHAVHMADVKNFARVMRPKLTCREQFCNHECQHCAVMLQFNLFVLPHCQARAVFNVFH